MVFPDVVSVSAQWVPQDTVNRELSNKRNNLCYNTVSSKINNTWSSTAKIFVRVNDSTSGLSRSIDKLIEQFIIENKISNIGLYIIAIAQALAILLYIVFRCCKVMCVDFTRKQQTLILLQILSANTSVFLQVAELDGLHTEYSVTADAAIDSIHVGCSFTGLYVNIRWPTFRVIDQITGAETFLKACYPISMCKAITLTRKLKRSYAVLVMAFNSNQMFRMNLDLPIGLNAIAAGTYARRTIQMV